MGSPFKSLCYPGLDKYLEGRKPSDLLHDSGENVAHGLGRDARHPFAVNSRL